MTIKTILTDLTDNADPVFTQLKNDYNNAFRALNLNISDSNILVYTLFDSYSLFETSSLLNELKEIENGKVNIKCVKIKKDGVLQPAVSLSISSSNPDQAKQFFATLRNSMCDKDKYLMRDFADNFPIYFSPEIFQKALRDSLLSDYIQHYITLPYFYCGSDHSRIEKYRALDRQMYEATAVLAETMDRLKAADDAKYNHKKKPEPTFRSRWGFLNPFHILDTKEAPYSRILRSSFREKMIHTFEVISGIPMTRESHARRYMGLLLYITILPILPVLFFLDYIQNPAAWLLLVPAIAISLPAILIHITASVILTAIAAPFVGIVHALSELKAGRELKQKALSLKLARYNESFENTTTKTLGECLKDEKAKFADLYCFCKGNYQELVIKFHRSDKGMSGYHALIDFRKPKDVETFNALVALNVGDITWSLEKAKKHNNVINFSMFKSPPATPSREQVAHCAIYTPDKYR